MLKRAGTAAAANPRAPSEIAWTRMETSPARARAGEASAHAHAAATASFRTVPTLFGGNETAPYGAVPAGPDRAGKRRRGHAPRAGDPLCPGRRPGDAGLAE